MGTFEPRFCDAHTGCHGHQVRCYLTNGQHVEGIHKGLCVTRDSRDALLHSHLHEWPVMAEQTRTECGAA